ncbi:exodeoxyribonuclease III [bacterium]|nr:exodeoxyribonuclease III [bacterium]
MKRIFSWNVNGIRAWANKGLIEWLKESSPDIIAIQETKAHPDQLSDELLNIEGYTSYFSSAVRKGYSGTAVYTKEKPVKVESLGNADFDNEGRTVIAHYPEFTLINSYFPNSQAEGARLEYKLAYCDFVLNKCGAFVDEGRNVVICGDFNIAHTEIDLKNPKANEKNPGYLPEERQWMSKFLDSGYVDVFRNLHPGEPGHYTWWSYRFNARAKDIGWRIDYFCVDKAFSNAVKTSEIHKDVMGSDHCPLSITLDV